MTRLQWLNRYSGNGHDVYVWQFVQVNNYYGLRLVFLAFSAGGASAPSSPCWRALMVIIRRTRRQKSNASEIATKSVGGG